MSTTASEGSSYAETGRGARFGRRDQFAGAHRREGARRAAERRARRGRLLEGGGLRARARQKGGHPHRGGPAEGLRLPRPITTEAIIAALERFEADYVVLAGFLYVLGDKVVENYDRRIINVHPALIPSFCGDGMYGLHVHEAALAYGVKVTGATVHFVNEVTDGGQIILQKAVDVLPGDTPERLQRRVMEQAEWVLLRRRWNWYAADNWRE